MGARGYGGLAAGTVDGIGGADISIAKNSKIRFLVGVYIHEDIHTSGPNDNVMAKRFDDLGLFPKAKPGSLSPGYKEGNTIWNSLSWDSVLDRYCLPTEAEMRRW